MIKRTIQRDIEKYFFQSKLIIIQGARQVGKTTLVKELQKKYPADSLYLNCDEPDVRSSLTNTTSTAIKSIIGRKKVIFIDEAQRVLNIGLTLKLMVDQFPDVQVVATGSSSLDLSNSLGVNKQTISNYIDLLEKSFVVFRLTPFSRNLRNELTKLRKVYFYDTGIRNALINNINALHLRQDVGQLWENFMISERLKQNDNSSKYVNSYFWRTYKQNEIDYIEEKGGQLSAFEFK